MAKKLWPLAKKTFLNKCSSIFLLQFNFVQTNCFNLMQIIITIINRSDFKPLRAYHFGALCIYKYYYLNLLGCHQFGTIFCTFQNLFLHFFQINFSLQKTAFSLCWKKSFLLIFPFGKIFLNCWLETSFIMHHKWCSKVFLMQKNKIFLILGHNLSLDFHSFCEAVSLKVNKLMIRNNISVKF